VTKKSLEQAILDFIKANKEEFSAAEQELFTTEIEHYQGNYPHILFQFLASLYPAKLNAKLARGMNWLTVALVIVAVVQAGVAILQTIVTVLSMLISVGVIKP
jgi:heme A synthase